MSCYLMFNSWTGDDQDSASDKIAQIFRMDNSQASEIVNNLVDGNPWQFEHQVSNQQSEVAEQFLARWGFDIECIPIVDDDFAFESANGAHRSNGTKKGFMSKVFSMFSKSN